MSRFLTTAPLLAMSLLVLSAAGPLSEQEVRQTGESIAQAYKKASQAKDAAALAAAYTEHAILVVPEGPLVGRAAIERYFNNAFKVFTLEAAQLDRVSMIADGRVMLKVGSFTGTVKRSNGMAPVALRAKSRLSGPSRHPDWRFVESDTVRGIGARNLYVSYEPLHGKDPRAAQPISPPVSFGRTRRKPA